MNWQKRFAIQFAVTTFNCLVLALFCAAQTQENQPKADSGNSIIRKIGTVTSVNGTAVVIKPEAEGQLTAVVQENARILRVAPGERDLKNAAPATLKELQTGDRILVGGKAAADGSLLAFSIVMIKKTDVAQKEAREREDWQKRGVGGLVKSVDPAAGAITIAITPTYNVIVKTSKATSFFRYSPNSVQFSDARPATLEEIKIGDQLRAKGNRSTDQQEVAAEQIISGSFRNIAGTLVAIDAASGTLTVKDILAKKTVAIRVSADSHLQKLPPPIAQRMAALLRKPAQASSTASQATGDAGKSGPPPDVQQLLSKAPPVTLAELQKDNAVIIVSTQGVEGQGLKAITLLSGVEPILTAAPDGKAAAALLTGWNVSAVLNDPTAP